MEHVILGYRAILDEEKLGLDIVRAVIEVKITPERGGGFDRLAERIAKYSEVQSCYLMSGGYDLLVVVQGKQFARSRDVRFGKNLRPCKALSPQPRTSCSSLTKSRGC